MLCRAAWFTGSSGTLTSGTGIPAVKPELSLYLSWSCLISFDRVQASCGCPRRSCSSISAIAGPDCQLSVRCSDAATLMVIGVRSACHLHSCLLWPSCLRWCLKYSLQRFLFFGDDVSSFTILPVARNASLCFAVRQTACTAKGIIPTLKLN